MCRCSRVPAGFCSGVVFGLLAVVRAAKLRPGGLRRIIGALALRVDCPALPTFAGLLFQFRQTTKSFHATGSASGSYAGQKTQTLGRGSRYPTGAIFCDGEERRAGVDARSALRKHSHRGCPSVESEANQASSALRPRPKYRSAGYTQCDRHSMGPRRVPAPTTRALPMNDADRRARTANGRYVPLDHATCTRRHHASPANLNDNHRPLRPARHTPSSIACNGPARPCCFRDRYRTPPHRRKASRSASRCSC